MEEPHREPAAVVVGTLRVAVGPPSPLGRRHPLPAVSGHVARLYLAGEHTRVMLSIDNAPWHRGKPEVHRFLHGTKLRSIANWPMLPGSPQSRAIL